MPNPLQIGDALDLVDVAIQKINLKSEDPKGMVLYDQYYNVESGVQDYYLKDSSLSGLGYAGRIVEGAVVTAQSPVQGYDKTFTQVRFGVLLSVTWEMWNFGIKKRKLENLVDQARQACNRLRELRCAERLSNGFSTSYTAEDESGNYTVTATGGDALELFSIAHTREDSGTNNNNVVYDGTTYSMDWEYDALKAAHRTASLIKDPKGLPMNINPDTFIFTKGLANHFRAIEMLGAMNKGWIPGSAERDSAGVPTFKVIANPWLLSNTGYWFAFDSTKKNDQYGLQYKESKPISLEGPNIVFKTDVVIKNLVSYGRKFIEKFFQIRWTPPFMETIPSQAL